MIRWLTSLPAKRVNKKTAYWTDKNLSNDNNTHFDEEASIDGNINSYGLVEGQSASIYWSFKGACTWKSISIPTFLERCPHRCSIGMYEGVTVALSGGGAGEEPKYSF